MEEKTKEITKKNNSKFLQYVIVTSATIIVGAHIYNLAIETKRDYDEKVIQAAIKTRGLMKAEFFTKECRKLCR